MLRNASETGDALSAPPPARGELDALWAGFAGARSASAFCENWLALQCLDIKSATAGLLLLDEGGGRFTRAAVWPDKSRDVTSFAGPAQDALRQRRGLIAREGARGLVAYPIEVSGQARGAVIVELDSLAPEDCTEALRRLHWGVGWLETLLRRREAEGARSELQRTGLSLDILALAAEHGDQREAAVAIATGLASRLRCDRVSIGLAKGGRISLLAISHQANFLERAQIVDAIENAMEEAYDQDAPAAHPAAPGTQRRIALAQAELARVGGLAATLSVPLAASGRPLGALTLERGAGGPFTDEHIAQVQAIAVALGPLVEARARSQRLLAGKLVDDAEKGLKALFGPRRPGLKLAALGVLGAVAFLSFAKAEFRLSARTAIEGEVQRAASAPFDGFVAEAPARAGDRVEAGQLLVRLDTRELEVEAARWRAEREQQALKYQEALGKQERAQAAMLAAQLRQAEAQLALVEDKLDRAAIKAPVAGLVVSGDLSQMLGAPVETGKLLFEIAPLDAYRAILQVEERDMPYLGEAQAGTVLLTGQAGEPLPLKIEKITPVATVQDGKNTFRVEAKLTNPPRWVRPGMEGVAKIDVDQRNIAWVWARSLIDWVRLTLWTWLP